MADVNKSVKITMTVQDNTSDGISSVKNSIQALAGTLREASRGMDAIAASLKSMSDSLSRLDFSKLDFSKVTEGVKQLEGINTSGIAKIATALEKFGGVTVDPSISNLVSLKELSGTTFPSLQKISSFIETVKGVQLPDFSAFVAGLSSLKDVKVPEKLKELGPALANLKGIGKLPDLTPVAQSLQSFASIQKLPAIGTFVSNLRELAKLSKFPDLSALSNTLIRLSSITGVPDISKLVEGIKNLKTDKLDIKKLQGLATALAAMASVGNAPSITAFVNSLQKLQGINIPNMAVITSQLNQLGNAFAKMSAASPFITAMNQVQQVSQQVQSSLNQLTRAGNQQGTMWEKLGEKVKRYLTYRAIADSVIYLKEAFTNGMGVIVEYDQALKDLQAITQSSDLAVKQMGETIKQVASTTKFSASEVAVGMRTLGQAGFTATEAIQTMQAVSDLATGTLTDMATSVDLVSTAMRVFAIDATESARVADVFANAVNRSKLTIDKIRIAMNYVGPVAEASGVSFEEMAAAMGTLANAGQRASTIGTGLRRIFAELVDPTDKMASAAAEAGISLKELDPRARSLSEVINSLRLVLVDSQVAFELFGKRGASAALNLVSVESNYDQMLATISQSGTAAKMAATQMEGLGVSFKNLKDKIGLVAVALGEAGVTQVLKLLVDAIRPVVDMISTLIGTTIGKLIVKITLLSTAIAGLVAAFYTFQKMTVAASLIKWAAGFSAISAAAGPAAASVTLFGRAFSMALAPALGVAVVAILAIIAAIKGVSYYLNSASENVEKFTLKAGEFGKVADSAKNFENRLADIKEGTEVARQEFARYRQELLDTAKKYESLRPAASAAARSINLVAGTLTDGGRAIAAFREEAAQLELQNIAKAYSSSVQAMADSTTNVALAWHKVLNMMQSVKQYYKDLGDLVVGVFDLDFEKIKKNYLDVVLGPFKVLKNILPSEGQRIAQAFKAGEMSLATLGDYLKKLDSSELDATQRKLQETFDKAIEQGTELTNQLVQMGKISMSDTTGEIVKVAESMGIASKDMEALVLAFEKMKSVLGESEISVAERWAEDFENGKKGVFEYIQVYKEYGKEITAERMVEVQALEERRKALIEYAKEVKSAYQDAIDAGASKLEAEKIRVDKEEDLIQKRFQLLRDSADNITHAEFMALAEASKNRDNDLAKLEKQRDTRLVSDRQFAIREREIMKQFDVAMKNIFSGGADAEAVLKDIRHRNKIVDRTNREAIADVERLEALGTINHEKAERQKLEITIKSLSERYNWTKAQYERIMDLPGQDPEKVAKIEEEMTNLRAKLEEARTDVIINKREEQLELLERMYDREKQMRENSLAKQEEAINESEVSGVITHDEALVKKGKATLEFYKKEMEMAADYARKVAESVGIDNDEYRKALENRITAEKKYHEERGKLLEDQAKERKKALEDIEELEKDTARDIQDFELKRAETNKDVQKKMVENEEKYAERVSEVNEKLNRKLEDLERDRTEKYKDFAEDRVDAEQKANADLITSIEGVDDALREVGQKGKSDRRKQHEDEKAALDKLRRGIQLVNEARSQGDEEALKAGKELIDQSVQLFQTLDKRDAQKGLKKTKAAYADIAEAQKAIDIAEIDKDQGKVDEKYEYEKKKAEEAAQDELKDASVVHQKKIQDITDEYNEAIEKENLRHQRVLEDYASERAELNATLNAANEILSNVTGSIDVGIQFPTSPEVEAQLQGILDRYEQLKDKTITITTKYVEQGAPIPAGTATQTTEGAFNGGLIGMFKSGGSVFRRLVSPFITAGKGFLDDVPALLSKGEFVQRARAVREYGVGFMRAVNNLQFPKALARGFADGGIVNIDGLRSAIEGMGQYAVPRTVFGDTRKIIDNSSISTYHIAIGNDILRPRGRVPSLTNRLIEEVKHHYK